MKVARNSFGCVYLLTNNIKTDKIGILRQNYQILSE